MLAATIYNSIFKSKYDKLMLYLNENYPGVYEEIRIKPIFGSFYARGAYKKSIDFASDHEPFDDPIAENLFADYAKFSSYQIWFLPAFILAFIGGIVLDVALN